MAEARAQHVARRLERDAFEEQYGPVRGEEARAAEAAAVRREFEDERELAAMSASTHDEPVHRAPYVRTAWKQVSAPAGRPVTAWLVMVPVACALVTVVLGVTELPVGYVWQSPYL